MTVTQTFPYHQALVCHSLCDLQIEARKASACKPEHTGRQRKHHQWCRSRGDSTPKFALIPSKNFLVQFRRPYRKLPKMMPDCTLQEKCSKTDKNPMKSHDEFLKCTPAAGIILNFTTFYMTLNQTFEKNKFDTDISSQKNHGIIPPY